MAVPVYDESGLNSNFGGYFMQPNTSRYVTMSNCYGNFLQRTAFPQRNNSHPSTETVVSSRKRRGESLKNGSNKDAPVFAEPWVKKKKSFSQTSESSPKAASGLNYEKLSEDIIQFSNDCQQTEDILHKKLRLRSTLLSIFRREFPAASLHLVGSSCNGFASKTSDADFCLMLTQWRKVDQKFEAVVYLRRLQKILKQCPYIKDLQVIRAKVPILKFRDSVSGCLCDVNINNSVGIRNTHLLRTYSRVDSRVRPLIVTVKRWAQAAGINDASQGTLSSYSLVLMVINYLQAGTKPAVIPSIQNIYPDCFRGDMSVDHLPMFDAAEMIPCNRSTNTQPVGELLEGFLDYYGNQFRWDFLAVSVRLGRATPKPLNRDWAEKPICIEEPFDLTNTARSVCSWDSYSRIKAEFKRAHDYIKENRDLDGLFHCNS
eukprot:gene9680-10667_t